MPEKNDIPIFRNLDGVYYRVVRDGIHVNRCFSDLSEAEQDVIMVQHIWWEEEAPSGDG